MAWHDDRASAKGDWGVLCEPEEDTWRIGGGAQQGAEEDTLLFLQVPYSLMARLIPAESLHFDKQISIVNDFVHRCQVNL